MNYNHLLSAWSSEGQRKRKVFLFCIVIMTTLLPSWSQTPRQRTNLPTLYINTLDGSGITNKKTYKLATMYWVEGGNITRYDSLEIRGRGNSTWGMAKKPYRIKIKKKQKLLGKGYANARNWTLLANCADKTMLRNALTSEVGVFLGLSYNPAARFVDFYLNNRYLGTYQISDQVDIRPHRVDIVEQEMMVREDKANITGGYLLEATANTDSDDKYFRTNKGVRVRIHSPKPDSIVNRQVQYIQNYVMGFESALFSSSFGDPTRGYRNYVDTTSLLAWYTANEIASNPDGFYSTYFYKEKDDPHLYWGPLWDNDISYNNTIRKGDVTEQLMSEIGFGDGITKVWLSRMWEDEWFISALNRFYRKAYKAGLTDFMERKVDSLAAIIRLSQAENYKVWNIKQQYYEEIVLYSTYDEYVEDLKAFIRGHNEFLLNTFCMSSTFEADTTCYYRISNKSNPLGVLDIYGSIDDPESMVRLCMYANRSDRIHQQWRIRPLKDGTFMLLASDKEIAVTDAYDDTPSISTLLLERADSNDTRQQWQILPQDKGRFFNIKNVKTGRVANNRNGSTINNNMVVSYESDNRDATTNSRLWSISSDGAIPSPSMNSILKQERTADYALMYNPTLQEVHFVAPDLAQLRFECNVFSLEGRMIGHFKGQESFSTERIPKGTYIISWTDQGKRHSAKFMKR